MSGALRQRRWRRRRCQGRVCVTVEVDETALASVLIDSGFLAAADEDDPRALRAALEHVIELWANDAVTRYGRE